MVSGLGKILVVDDDRFARVVLSSHLRQKGYSVEAVEDGQHALEMLAAGSFDVVLLDLVMPGVDGYEVLRRMKDDAALRHIPVIVVSSMDEMESVVRCIEMGATDHLPKPFNPVLLHARINASLATKRLHDQEETYRRQVEEYNHRLESRVQEQVAEIQDGYQRLQRALEASVLALASAVESRDPYTAGHQQRVSKLAYAIAKEMGLTDSVAEEMRVAGILHDVGKISVPIEILCKPGPITEAEFRIIQIHPRAGYDVLKGIEFPWPIADVVLQHQERLDGSGYPAGMTGEQILLEARILGVADVVEAMATHRPYRAALGLEKAVAEISQGRGTLYDADAVDACLALLKRAEFLHDWLSEA